MPQSFASLHVHIVFSTKHRERTLASDIRSRLYKIIGGILRDNECRLVSAGGTDDHIHLLASISRTITVADVVRLVKTNSSNWIHREIAALRDFQWQYGYGAFAVSYSGLDAVKVYLANQEVHHATKSFQDEFRELLTRHGIELDERYVWD
jgi:putative transposase